MTTETFTWKRQSGASGSIKHRVTTAEFGDGYSQSISHGINTKQESWPLSFEGSLAEMRAIVAFFDRHKGSKSFNWTSPTDDTPKLWCVSDYGLTSIGGGVYRVTATFKQVFYR